LRKIDIGVPHFAKRPKLWRGVVNFFGDDETFMNKLNFLPQIFRETNGAPPVWQQCRSFGQAHIIVLNRSGFRFRFGIGFAFGFSDLEMYSNSLIHVVGS